MLFKEKEKKDEEYIRTLKSELDKKDKIINLMANEIYITAVKNNGTHFNTDKEVIDYFTKKVSE